MGAIIERAGAVSRRRIAWRKEFTPDELGKPNVGTGTDYKLQYLVDLECWNLLGVAGFTHRWKDPETGNLIFVRAEMERRKAWRP